jgi:drug/metabolite transporter (DMT)-like permease
MRGTAILSLIFVYLGSAFGVTQATLIQSFIPVRTAMLAALMLREPRLGRRLAGIALSLMGCLGCGGSGRGERERPQPAARRCGSSASGLTGGLARSQQS